MFKGSWIVAVALGLALILFVCWSVYATGLKLGETKAQNAYHTSRYAAHATNEIKRSCLNGNGSYLPECVAEVIQSTNEDQRAQSDLEAQTKMALWAFWMLVSTIVMAGITLVGVVYVYQTLVATRQIGQNQTRPWVMVAGYDRGQDDKDGAFLIAIRWKNFGVTPANNLRMFVESKVVDTEEETPHLQFRSGELYSPASMAPGMQTPSSLQRIARSDYLACLDRKKAIILYGAATYEDIFGVNHITETTFRITFDGQQLEGKVWKPRIEAEVEGGKQTLT